LYIKNKQTLWRKKQARLVPHVGHVI